MSVHALAGKLPPQELLINVPRLVSAYYLYAPDPENPFNRIEFGTSGHRGSSLDMSFNEAHILAISHAICEYRESHDIQGPIFMGMDTHALSEPALYSALEVFTAHEVQVFVQKGLGYTPTPVISHAILNWNQKNQKQADGVVITPSHNPPEFGGFKYNPPQAGPADNKTTAVIQKRANEILAQGLKEVRRIPAERALKSDFVHYHDYIYPYVLDLQNVINMKTISDSGLRIGVDPMGGSGLAYWDVIADTYNLNIEVVNRSIDPTFAFLPVDKDGQIRMDCSSEYAMSSLLALKDNYDIAWGNDPDYDRHGIVTKGKGLMNPNHYLTSAVWYLFQTRKHWDKEVAVGKTLVTSSMLDRVAQCLSRKLVEYPVGFKWFVPDLLNGVIGFAGEESAGASFLRSNARVWTTDKDGIIMDFLAAEMTATLNQDPLEIYKELEKKLGAGFYKRIDAFADTEQKEILKKLSAQDIKIQELAGEKILDIMTKAPGNDAPIGGVKVTTKQGWFAARSSGTEDIYKIYAESFKGEEHLNQIVEEAQTMLDALI